MAPLLPRNSQQVKVTMKAHIWNGARTDNEKVDHICSHIESSLANRGFQTQHLRIRDLTIKPCVGCSGCYHTRPGQCGIKDDGQAFIPEIPHQDILVMVSRVVFGGVSSTLKKAIDRCNPMTTCIMTGKSDATRFIGRYQTMPKVLFVGLLDDGDGKEAEIFKLFAQRASKSLQASAVSCALFSEADSETIIKENLEDLLHNDWRMA